MSVALSILAGKSAARVLAQRGKDIMTGLGATLYFGFFGLAAAWLYLTSGRVRGRMPRDQDQEREFSNVVSISAGPVGSSPWWASHSSQK